MTPFFAFPVAFAAGAAFVAALVAIYVLRNRLPALEVSSLFLWAEAPKTKEGGRKIKRLAMPLLFFLELAAILLLTLAAARPFLPLPSTATPLVVVLDDSFSMRAGEPDSPRERALRFLTGDFDAGRVSSVRVILAGAAPVLAGEPAGDARVLRSIDAAWHCADTRADLRGAVALAMEAGGPRARILVVSDHAPDEIPASPRIVWRAFGEPRDNLAFVSAVRSSRESGQQVRLEIANVGTKAMDGILSLASGTGEPRATPLSLGPGETRRLSLAIPEGNAPIDAALSGDSLDFDNAITLLPSRPRDIRVALAISDAALREPVESALIATGSVALVSPPPLLGTGAIGEDSRGLDLLVTDRQDASLPRGGWVLELRRGASPVALGGPFLVNAAHPLTEGVSLGGVVWGSARGTMPGTPVISAGNTSLVTDEVTGDGGHLVRVSLAPGLSTLQRTPAWPALVWNLVDWRSRSIDGFRDPNIRVGALARFTRPAGIEEVTIVEPGGRRRSQPLAGRTLMVRASRPGVWSAVAGDATYRFAANPIAPDESNLSSAATGTWGSWTAAPEPGETTRDLAWVAALLALAILLGHQRLVSREAA
jgi:hypothetical protein